MNWKPTDWRLPPRLTKRLANGLAWLGKTIHRIWTGLAWVPRNYVKLLSVFFLILLPAWIWMILELLGDILILTDWSDPNATPDNYRSIAYALGVTITALAGLLAAPLVLIRAWVSERHTTTAEQGLITDRFTRAVEQLGVEKTVKRREFKPRFKVKDDGDWLLGDDDEPIPATRPDGKPLGEWETFEETVPNLEVRLGAIYALERIAQDSERDHIPIMETLCAYIRENSQDHIPTDEETRR